MRWRTILIGFTILLPIVVVLLAFWRQRLPNVDLFEVALPALIALGVWTLVYIIVTEWRLRSLRDLILAAELLAEGKLDVSAMPRVRGEVSRLSRAVTNIVYKRQRQTQKRDRDTDRLNTILAYMADGVMILSRKGKVRLLNPAAERILNTTEKEADGHTFVQVVRDYRMVELWKRCQENSQEEIEGFELDDDRFVRVIITPFMKRAARGYLVILQDLTRMRRLQTIRQDFVSNVSHELRTPLASLRALAETLYDGALEDPPAAKRFLGRMEVEIDKLVELVQDLLELSQIESNNLSLELSEMTVKELITPFVECLQPQAERANVELDIVVESHLPPILVDSKRIQQVVTNLVHNSIKFTLPQGKICVSAACDNGDVTVSVADNGAGIAEEDLPRIFERFYKSDRARAGGGSGLGLAIAKHIVQAHRGEIWVESVEGKGSTFYFSIPVAEEVKTQLVQNQ